jgi:hypothetical protein
MRRRFGRGRRGRGGSEARNAPIDAARWFERLTAQQVVPVTHLEPVEVDGVPASFAVLGLGESEDGGRVLVGFAPRHGGDAALAAWAHGQRLAAEEGFDGEVFAVAPQWSVAARQRLSLLGEPPFAFRALAATALDEESRCVEAEGPVANLPLPAERCRGWRRSTPARFVDTPAARSSYSWRAASRPCVSRTARSSSRRSSRSGRWRRSRPRGFRRPWTASRVSCASTSTTAG